MGSSTIFLEQQLEVSVDRLWKALTNKEYKVFGIVSLTDTLTLKYKFLTSFMSTLQIRFCKLQDI
jgi:hypothetical protein